MWRALVDDGWVPEKVTRGIYDDVKVNRDKYPPHIVGWVGFNCSYSGKYFGGFAGETQTKTGIVRDYQAEAIRNVLRQVDGMRGVVFENRAYYDLDIPSGSIVYCDPPYEGTTQYANEFNHGMFWDWVRDISKRHRVFVSEYSAPDDFECIWSKCAKSSLSANGVVGGNKESVERLFVHKSSLRVSNLLF